MRVIRRAWEKRVQHALGGPTSFAMCAPRSPTLRTPASCRAARPTIDHFGPASWRGELGQEEFLDLGPRVAATRLGRSSSHGLEAGARKASQNTWMAIDTNWSSPIAED